MSSSGSRPDFAAAQSAQDGTISLPGMHAAVTIRRDDLGVAHISASNEHDAWFGQGYASAQDRLWQMEYDRRRAAGRWSEVVGQSALAADRLSRRLQLGNAARIDVEAMSTETRAMFEAYAAGVNAFLTSDNPLPVEFDLAGIKAEPWEPWHSIAMFKVRHVLMGKWQLKLAQASLLARIGPQRFAEIDGSAPLGSPVILPPGQGIAELFRTSSDEIAAAAEALGFLAEAEAGSNAWAVHGSRTTTGAPMLCTDSHRDLDVPSVYWQVHVRCPEFDAVGVSFPGLPGFPHFGHNAQVAWCITHGAADTQDLYIEEFDGNDPSRYRTPDGWAQAERRSETITVQDGDAVTIDLWRTRHGPIVHGDPRSGHALALRYIATDEPCLGFEALRPMLRATSVAEVIASQRPWVDPVNNFVSADTAGNIGYLMRGRIPIRSSTAARQFPAPGWSGEHEWIGSLPFEDAPTILNPPTGFIETSNQSILPTPEPYIANEFSVPTRAERAIELLSGETPMSPAAIAAIQGDTLSRPAAAWARKLAASGPYEGEAEQARLLLSAFDGDLRPDSGAALLYAHFRRRVMRELYEPLLGSDAWNWLQSGEQPIALSLLNKWLYNETWSLDQSDGPRDGRSWDEILVPALGFAYRDAVDVGGSDPSAWRWDAVHATNAKHLLSGNFPDLATTLNPPRAALGGDADTVQNGGYSIGVADPFDINLLAVYRQVVDLADIGHAEWIVPAGVSALPETPHYVDQLERWRVHERATMPYTEADVEAATRHRLELLPIDDS